MPQLRRDPVTREWVVVAAERSRRPSDFKVGDENLQSRPAFSPTCPFCPGNELMTPPEVLAVRPPDSFPNGPGWSLRVVPNKFPALMVEGDLNPAGKGLYDVMNGVGAHEIIVETPDHDRSLGDLPLEQVTAVLCAYRDRFRDLRQDIRFKYILLFRNHGRLAGASQDHPHSQLIALPMIPHEAALQIEGAARYREYRERCVYCDMVKQELSDEERIVAANEEFVAFCAFAGKYPFETWIFPRRHQPSFEAESPDRLALLASILQETLQRIGRCLSWPPYNFTIHTAPVNLDRERDFHWHLSIMPRLSLAAGFEMGSGVFINVTAPEDAAAHLREAM